MNLPFVCNFKFCLQILIFNGNFFVPKEDAFNYFLRSHYAKLITSWIKWTFGDESHFTDLPSAFIISDPICVGADWGIN